MKSDIGLIGLAVMGENLALNLLRNGYQVSVFNRTVSKTEEFAQTKAANQKVVACLDLEQFCKSLSRPRKIITMVKAGGAVDDLINQLSPYLESGDIVIDGGNSHYLDTQRRFDDLAKKGIHFVGAGISGGEEGALKGPSIMPGGASAAWPEISPILTKIAAKVEGSACCDWVGPGGAGHFVKMVHNGIEYADMQLITESYQLLRDLAGLDNQKLSQVYTDWNSGELESYLIEITASIMSKKDEKTGAYLLDLILDSAGQKGTGKWTVNLALDQGQPSNILAEAVFARFSSAQLDERRQAAEIYSAPNTKKLSPELIEKVRRAVYCTKIAAYAQGFALMCSASNSNKWSINLGSVSMMWRGGCIIRSRFLGQIKNSYDKQQNLPNLLLSEFFSNTIKQYLPDWRAVVALAAENGIPIPVMGSALSYFDAYRSARLPANLIQAQRDFFGAHTYERIDQPRGVTFHTEW